MKNKRHINCPFLAVRRAAELYFTPAERIELAINLD